jgi:hypothetical protein
VSLATALPTADEDNAGHACTDFSVELREHRFPAPLSGFDGEKRRKTVP